MKKLLIATTALVATAASAQMVAAQNVNISGLGRFGLDYNNGRADDVNKTQVVSRLRFNIDASVTTDTGVTFGGRIRMQYDQNTLTNSVATEFDPVTGEPLTLRQESSARLSPAMLYASANGFRVEVGNVNTAIDSVALMYDSEIGAFNRSFGGPIGTFYAFSTAPYANSENRMGVFGSYAIEGLNIRASYVSPNQTGVDIFGDPVEVDEELSVSADYRTGDFTVAGAYARNSGGVDDRNEWFLGAAYQFVPGGNVGLLYSHLDVSGDDDVTRVTLYGNYRVDAITYRGYVARDDNAANDTKTAFGIGLDYDLGGARLGADVHRDYGKNTIAGLGVRFDF